MKPSPRTKARSSFETNELSDYSRLVNSCKTRCGSRSIGQMTTSVPSHRVGESGPTILDLPFGIDAAGQRSETDPNRRNRRPRRPVLGAPTQRSLTHFSIGDDRMPKAVYHAYGYLKKAAALVNGRLHEWKAQLMARVPDEVIAVDLVGHFTV
jgi:fumarate hydratase class II